MTFRRLIPWPLRVLIVAGTVLATGEVLLEARDIDVPQELAAPPEAPLPAVATVLSWRDADTLVTTAGPIRLENVEAPEARPHDWKCDDPQLAAAALAHAQALAPVGSTVTLRYEGRMSWDRHIAWAALPDGTDLGEALYATRTVATYPNDSGECPAS